VRRLLARPQRLPVLVVAGIPGQAYSIKPVTELGAPDHYAKPRE
jgi:hypothetical protein